MLSYLGYINLTLLILTGLSLTFGAGRGENAGWMSLMACLCFAGCYLLSTTLTSVLLISQKI